MKTRFWLMAVLASGLAGACSALAAPDPSNPNQLRREADKLSERAQDLKADGQGDEATKLVKEADKLREVAAKMEKESNPRRPNQDNQPRDREQEFDKLRAELKELEASGNREEAANLKRRLGELDNRRGSEPRPREFAMNEDRMRNMNREIEELHRQGRHEEANGLERETRGMRGGPRPSADRGPGPGEPGDAQRRLQHLQIAIENLHAAGLHDQAEQLEREAQSMGQQRGEMRRPMQPQGQQRREGFAPRRGPSPPGTPNQPRAPMAPGAPGQPGSAPMPPGGPMPQGEFGQWQGPGPRGMGQNDARVAELQSEVRDLRDAVQDLRKRLDEMSRKRK